MSNSEENFKHMQISELHKVLTDKTHVVVDIRDPASFQAGHIPNAIHLSNDSLPDFLRTADLDEPVVVCCYHGISSQQAAQFLISQDFTEVYSLDGGYTDWQLQHPDVVES
ncbi:MULTISPECIES: thiosulfate sulfurtransferase GlpE [unclassified Colwellia]|jgi:thiosulfate sulfurtransferase|uniref:thiosulfate sulfurtransferase GlpE n=1 Tax=unclassified Colwellia TaxID=196834 RepID=UPI000D3B780B|nr:MULTISPECIES: thiosulfate sulfurtransferase GlpE [unclassified Colwellia]AWB59197.1 thiosulfate sulfurtransferase GlpE [Colwellia sp. Arc7-D]MBA6416873.1 thiosulfate sulfurtransferase GlpE [Colwellia sp. 6M3]|tara:strand:+ start:43 stop:375 length:333 start_codon:yes stop_codon:yes gene_type:complete